MHISVFQKGQETPRLIEKSEPSCMDVTFILVSSCEENKLIPVLIGAWPYTPSTWTGSMTQREGHHYFEEKILSMCGIFKHPQELFYRGPFDSGSCKILSVSLNELFCPTCKKSCGEEHRPLISPKKLFYEQG